MFLPLDGPGVVDFAFAVGLGWGKCRPPTFNPGLVSFLARARKENKSWEVPFMPDYFHDTDCLPVVYLKAFLVS